jgi:ATP-dependent Lon protease
VELGQIDPAEREMVQLLRRIETTDLPTHVGSRARHEVERLRSVGVGGPESEDIRTYLDWLLKMPWSTTSGDFPGIDLDRVRQVLDDRAPGS